MFVRMWMTKDPITIRTDQSVAEAHLCLKENSVRRLPVVDKKHNLVGIVSATDIYNALPSVVDGSSAGDTVVFSESTTIAEIMTTDPMSVGLMTPLEKVAQRMRQHKVGAMPVLEKNELIGIITESDIFRAFMEVLGVNEDGVRVEILISKNSDALYNILAILKRYGMVIVALTIHQNYGKNQRLLTMKINGEELQPTLNEIRKIGKQINFISDENNVL